MSKSLAASKQLMQTYLSELLTEEEAEQVAQIAVKEKLAQPIDQLLNKVNVANQLSEHDRDVISTVKAESQRLKRKPVEKVAITIEKTATPVAKPTIKKTAPDIDINQPIKTRKSTGAISVKAKKNYREGAFQAMFFDVAGLLIAVPLIELGGIHNTAKTTPLMGKPDWFKGVMLYREAKINVVDTALWVMPEKVDDKLQQSLNYQYIIMLNNSSWGLMAENLVDTVTLNQEDVKWLDAPSKRPWLAGLVKDRMCALLDVESLIQLLDDGANITQE
jgi:purine-binding chemotaxis protein CheW